MKLRLSELVLLLAPLASSTSVSAQVVNLGVTVDRFVAGADRVEPPCYLSQAPLGFGLQAAVGISSRVALQGHARIHPLLNGPSCLTTQPPIPLLDGTFVRTARDSPVLAGRFMATGIGISMHLADTAVDLAAGVGEMHREFLYLGAAERAIAA